MTEKQQKAERIVRSMDFINNYNGELRIIKNKIYDGDNLVAIYKNNETYKNNQVYRNIQTRENYNLLLKSGMFWEMHPELSGDWEKDRDIIQGR